MTLLSLIGRSDALFHEDVSFSERDLSRKIKSSKFLSEKTRGIGATRRISFLDGTIVKEIVVGWRPKNYFSYIAVSGLPLRGYHATISIINKKNRQVDVEWESFFSSKQMTNDEFNSFFRRLSDFYTESLKNLKNSLEK